MKILLLDDESFSMELFVSELRDAGHEVQHVRKIDQAFEIIQKEKDFEVVILDIMMLPGKLYENSDTKGGLRTGELFVEVIRQELPEARISILTNVTDSEVLARLTEILPNRIFAKEDIDPTEPSDLQKLLN